MTPFGDPVLERIWAAALAARERRGAEGDGQFVLPAVTVAEADALDGLPWSGPMRTVLAGRDFKCRLSRFEAAVRQGGIEPAEGYLRFAGRAPIDLPARNRERRSDAERERARVHTHPAVAVHGELAHVLADSRIPAADVPTWLLALDVLTVLPAEPVLERAVLSARCFGGDAHALDHDGKVERVARGLLERLSGIEPGTWTAREVWGRWGVETDPLSSTVLTLNLRAHGDGRVAAAVSALRGTHTVLTLAQLSDQAADWEGGDVFVCENPSVVRAAERALGPRCAPLVCTGGWPSAAVGALLSALTTVGARLHHHGDFDWDGLAIHQALVRDVGAVPWRYGPEDYRAGITTAGRPLGRLAQRRRAVSGPLADALEAEQRQVPEEIVLAGLLADLRRD